MKTCTKCGVEKDEGEFYMPKKGHGDSACKTCVQTRNRAWAVANPERVKRNQQEWSAANPDRTLGYLLRKHNCPPDRYATLWAAQSGRCANVGCRTDVPGGHGSFHLDHDHACCPGRYSCGKCIRGLLCAPCNQGLGQFADSADRLYGAIEYLASTGPKLIGGPDALFVLKAQPERMAA